jgi:dynein regulatory complex protein 1
VQSEYETQDAKYKARNNALTSEYQRLTRQYRELQDSSRVVAAGDAAVYSEVASVHEAEMTAMTERLRVADKVITEQLLGYAWAPPAGAGEAEAGFPSVQQTEVATDGDGEAEAVAAPVLDPSRLLPLLRLLTTDAGAFLIESAVQASCDNLDKAGKRDKAEALQGDAVLRAVGATTPAAVASLVEWFEAALQAGGSTTGLLSDRRDGQPALPLGFSTVLTVKGWMTQRKAAAEAAGGKVALNETADVLARLSEASGTLGGAGATSSAPRSLAARLKAKEKEEQAKWDALLATVPPTTLRTWTSLEGAMGKYRGVVTKRAALVGEVSSLTQANQEVRALLAMYLAAPSAAGLQVPPTATMMLGPNTAALALTVGGAMTPAEALGVRPEALAVAQMGLTGAGEKL